MGYIPGHDYRFFAARIAILFLYIKSITYITNYYACGY